MDEHDDLLKRGKQESLDQLKGDELSDTTIKEFVHSHHDLMQLLADYDKK
ncbi:hypothetical protein [Weissella cibaria]|nr:hypothetical protein [Weissella cibaria]